MRLIPPDVSRLTLALPTRLMRQAIRRAWSGLVCRPTRQPAEILHRVGIADVRVGRPDHEGRDVFTIRSFEALAASVAQRNPYTDNWALQQPAADGGVWI